MFLSEKDELTLLRNASKQSFDILYLRYSGKLYNFVMKISRGNTYIAEELVQRTFLKVWETREYIDPNKSFISYLCTIAKNMLLNEYEHQSVQFIYKAYIKANSVDIDNYTEKAVDERFMADFIDKLVDNLPPRRKEIFILSRKEGFTNKQIAEKLHITESTIETQLSKALAFMKNHINKYYELMLIVALFLNQVY